MFTSRPAVSSRNSNTLSPLFLIYNSSFPSMAAPPSVQVAPDHPASQRQIWDGASDPSSTVLSAITLPWSLQHAFVLNWQPVHSCVLVRKLKMCFPFGWWLFIGQFFRAQRPRKSCMSVLTSAYNWKRRQVPGYTFPSTCVCVCVWLVLQGR